MQIFNILQQHPLPISAANTSRFCHYKINLARLVCYLIPAHCPFERNLQLWGKSVHIPAMCQLNPFYHVLMNWRWRALNFLNDAGIANI